MSKRTSRTGSSPGFRIRKNFPFVRSVLSRYDPVSRASLSPALARDASEKLETNSYIRGCFIAAGNRLRINETLVNALTDEIIKTFTVEGTSEEDLLAMIDSLTWETSNYLEIKAMEDKRLPYESLEMIQINSSEAFRNYIKGRELFMVNDYEAAISFFNRALEVDSSFAAARFQRAFAYHNMGDIVEGGGDMLKGREIHQIALNDLNHLEDQIEQLPFENQCLVRYLRSDYDKDPWEGIRQLEFMEKADHDFTGWWQLGINCYRVDQKERALEYFEKALEVEQRLEAPSKWVYSQAGWHDSAIVVYKQLLEQYPQQSSVKDALGRELIISGIDVPKGVEFCSLAVEQDSLNWNFQVHLGNGYFKLDSLEKAQTILQYAWNERTFFDGS